MRDPMWTAIERLERELRAAREHVERLERERNTAQVQAEWQLRAWTALRDNLDISSDKAEVIVRLTRERDKYRALFDEACAVLRSPDSTNDGGPGDLAEDIRLMRDGYEREVDEVYRKVVAQLEAERDEARAERDKLRAERDKLRDAIARMLVGWE